MVSILYEDMVPVLSQRVKVVQFGTAKLDHFLKGGLLFSLVVQKRVVMDFTAKNTCQLRGCPQ